MRGSEGVVDINVGEPGQAPGELGVIGLFPGVKPQVLEQQDIPRRELPDELLDLRPDAILDEPDRTPESLRERDRDRRERQLRPDLPLRFPR